MQSEHPTIEPRRVRLAQQRQKESRPAPVEEAPSSKELRALYADHTEYLRHGTIGGVLKTRYADADLTLEAFEELVDLLENRGAVAWQVRAAAAWLLGQVRLSEGQKHRVSKALCVLLRERKSGMGVRWQKRVGYAALPSVALLGLGGVFALVLGRMTALPQGQMVGQAALFFSTLIGLGMLGVRWHNIVTQQRDVVLASLRTLCKFALPDSLPILFDTFTDTDTYKVSEKALLATLPKLETSQYGRIEPTLIAEMCNLLTDCTPWHPPLMIALVEALERVGTKEAIRPVQKVMSHVDRGSFPQFEVLSEAVERTLEILRARAEIEEELEAQERQYHLDPYAVIREEG